MEGEEEQGISGEGVMQQITGYHRRREGGNRIPEVVGIMRMRIVRERGKNCNNAQYFAIEKKNTEVD